MDIFSCLDLLGGLGLFLFGMYQMGDGLEKASSGRLEIMLNKLTSNRTKAVLLGAVVTAIIQSSSATTVTVMGFVNSGIMKLAQAIPVVMGANIGTTTTGWLLSLTGMQGGPLILRLLNPSSFSPVLAIIGSILVMFCKTDKKKNLGGVLLGFAILMFGMDMMSGAMKPLADMPEFSNLLTMFENPILGLLSGILLTALIQSSSATVGIIQALSVTGSLSYAAAIPLLLGQNIGACMPTLLSCIGANKETKRVSMVYMYFNIIGALLFMIPYLILYYTADLAFFAMAVDPISIALMNTGVNMTVTIILLPFPQVLEKLAVMTIPDHAESRPDAAPVLLDERLLATSAFAIRRCKELTIRMAEEASATFLSAISLMDHFDAERAQRIVDSENRVDRYEDELGTFLVKLSANNLSEDESRETSKILHSIGDFERISDHAVNMMEVAQEIDEKKIQFTEEAQAELNVLTDAVREVMDLAIRSFETGDVPLAKWVEPLEEVVDDIIRELKLRHIERLRAGKCTVETGFVFADLLTNYERVADHCSNLAICVIELAQGEYNAHEYAIKTGAQSDFAVLYNAGKRKYALPKA